MKPLVYIVRHGATDLNGNDSTDRIRGWIDVPLNDEGIKEAHRAAKMLENTNARRVISSDLKRAKDTAKIISLWTNLPMEITKALRPWNLGHLQGRYTKDILQHMMHYIEHGDKMVPEGETFKTFRIRYLTALNRILRSSVLSILVTHFRNMKTIQAWIKAGHKPNFQLDTAVLKTKGDLPGSIFVLTDKFELKQIEAGHG